MLKEAIKTFEELKKYVFIINRGDKESIVIKFENSNFYHLLGLHKIKINNFFPNKKMTKDKIYKYLKANTEKYENILADLIKEQKRIELRIATFPNILKLLNESDTVLYDLKNNKPIGSLYNGNYGLFNHFDKIYCLLGLKIDNTSNNIILCAPQSWMPSNRRNNLIEFKHPTYMKEIIKIPIKLYNEMVTEVLT